MNARTEARPMGIVYGMSFEDYHAVEAFSASGMKHLARSPWHWRNRVPMQQTRAMLCGSLVHCAQLEPNALAARYVVVPEDAPRRPSVTQWKAKNPSPDSVAAMQWWTAFASSASGRSIIPAEDFATTQQQLQAIASEPELAEAFSKGDSEVSMFWVDPATGVYCKARPDHITRKRDGRVQMLDLKSMADDTPAGVMRAMGRLGLYRQEAHYRRGYQAITGVPVSDFVFAVVSSVPPILATPYRLVDDALQQGIEEVEDLLREFAQCQRADRWPAYKPDQRMLDLPAWCKTGGEVEVEFAE